MPIEHSPHELSFIAQRQNNFYRNYIINIIIIWGMNLYSND